MPEPRLPLTAAELAAVARALDPRAWPRPRRCCVCGTPEPLVALVLCDAPQSPQGTCDRPSCPAHAVHVPPDTDYCVHHASLAP